MASLIDLPQHGTVTANGDGSYHYVPAPDYNGSDGFSYSLSDANGVSELAHVSDRSCP